MEDQKSTKVPGGWPGLILLAAIASNLLWLHQPLKSSRPAEVARFQVAALGEQNAEARLWQDPFQAAELAAAKPVLAEQEHAPSPTEVTTAIDMVLLVQQLVTNLTESITIRPTKPSPSSIEPDSDLLANLRKQIMLRRDQRSSAVENPVTILPVMVTGSRYTEGSEWRVRSRYAVLSGLSRAGYVPADREHVGFIKVTWPRNAVLADPSANSAPEWSDEPKLLIPYEWLERYPPNNPDQKESVLVLWLHEEAFEFRPLSRLAQLIQALRPQQRASDANGEKTNAAPDLVRIIGPWGSTTLREMSREAGKAHDNHRNVPSITGSTNLVSLPSILTNVELYSASATAADWRLSPAYSNRPTRIDIKNALTNLGISFFNVTCTDDNLSEEMVRELDLRGINPNPRDGDSRIVLLAEWDTFYGRALPQAFVWAATNKAATDAELVRSNILEFSYLRGLDGELAGEADRNADDKPSGTDSNDSNDRQALLAKLERPEGNSQLDYARRLAWRLKQLEKEKARGSSNWDQYGHQFRAIGLFGSDVYDKLLLLQALGEYFPEALFFTTDLDARLTHPSQLSWSRNMLVASSFGLSLSWKFQGKIPPFRDSYQSAYFLATQVAVGGMRHGALALISPRVFEISHNGAYDLSDDSGPAAASLALYPVVTKLAPRHALRWFTPKSPLSVAALLLLVGGAFWMVRSVWKSGRSLAPEMKTRIVFASLVIAATAGLTSVAWVSHLAPNGEPVSFTEGISIWPAEYLRLAVVLIGCWSVWKWMHATDQEVADLRKQYACKAEGPEATPSKTETLNPWETWLFTKPAGHAVPPKGEDLIRDYIGCLNFRTRFRRMWPLLSVYLGAFMLLMVASGFPTVPYRGSVSRTVDYVLLGTSVFILLLTIFLLLDATLVCMRFIRRISLGPTWNEALARFRQERKMEQRHDKSLEHYIGIRAIADASAALGRFVQYPFIILVIMILARSAYFDRWRWPLPLTVVIGANFAVVFIGTLLMRQAAEKVRQKAIQDLYPHLSQAMGPSVVPSSSPTGPEPVIKAGAAHGKARNVQSGGRPADQIGLLIKEIQSLEEGAFAPLSRQPIFQAILMPFGGAGVLALLNYLAYVY